MRISAYLLIAAAMVAFMGSAAMAQDENAPAAPPQPGAEQAPPPAPGAQPGMGGPGQEMERYHRQVGQMMMRRMTEELNLTDQQKEQVKAAFHETMEANRPSEADRTKMQQLREQMKTAQENGDDAGFQQAMDQLSQMWEARQKAFSDELAPKLQAILTPEQMAKAKAMLAPRPAHKLGRMMAELRTMDLTDAQYDQIKSILDDAHDKVMAVLTPEQKEQLVKRMSQPMGGPGEGGMHHGEGMHEGHKMNHGGAMSQPAGENAGAAPAMP